MIPTMLQERTRFLSHAALVTVLIGAVAACSSRTDDTLLLREDERVLLTRLTRDPFIHITDLRRDDEDHLQVTTRQGDTIARYELSPENAASKELVIHRLVEEFHMRVSESDSIGTGPEPRGLKR
ncbi:MAG: hypothetical protein H0V44_11145 [Planctomycetes bacterium]|nr:hypothetical protein [Planctomycetota bacterium]